MSQLEAIKKLDAYRVVEHKMIEEIQSEGIVLEHKKTKARLFLVSNDDENKVCLLYTSFDSLYDPYKGVIVFCRIKEGTVKKGTLVRMMATGAQEEVVEVGYFGAGQFIPCDELSAGTVSYTHLQL